MTPELRHHLEKVYEFRELVPDYNGYGADAVEILAEFNSVCFLLGTKFLPDFILPGVSGGITMFFDIPNGKEVFVSFWNDGEIDYHDKPGQSWIFSIRDLYTLEEMLKKDLNNECETNIGMAKRPKS